uniref:Flavin-containing monooxygenase n=1 Tax=Setaria digitata TaxID=48799 RepID=A0A915PK56_9BILA
MSPRICVIGAGASGLTATKICLEYNFQVMCLEKSIDIGGLWRYKPHPCAPGSDFIFHNFVPKFEVLFLIILRRQISDISTA